MVLDVYDDPEYSVLRQAWPDADSMPGFVKTASFMSPEQLDALPDDHFALVLVDSHHGLKMRKYAMVDPAHTAMSTVYFLANRHALTEEAAKTAAARLVNACLTHGLEPPAQLLLELEQEKTADLYPSGTLRDLTTPPSPDKEPERSYTDHFPSPELRAQASQIQQAVDECNLKQDELRLRQDELRNQAKRLEMEQVNQIRLTQGEKVASLWVGGTLRSLTAPEGSNEAAPCSPSSRPYPDYFPDPQLRAQAQQLQLQDDQLSMQMDELRLRQQEVEVAAKRLELTQVQHLQHAQQPQEQQEGASPYVPDAEPPPPQPQVEKNSAADCLLVIHGEPKFPVRNYGEVEKAAGWFLQHHQGLPPEMRREYCTKLAARAHGWGITLPDVIEKYGSLEVDPRRRVYFDLRKQACADSFHTQLDNLCKMAAGVDPEVLVIALSELDKEAGLDRFYDRGIPDPYLSLFGITKMAGDYVNDQWSWTNDLGDTLTEDALTNLLQVESYRQKLEDRFDSAFVKALSADPISVFESLPTPIKTIIARIAAPST